MDKQKNFNVKTIRTEAWFQTYKSLQLFLGCGNDLFGPVCIPVSLNFIITASVLSLYILIGTDSTVQLKVVCFLVALVTWIVLHFLFTECVAVTDQSVKAIRRKQRQLNLCNTHDRSRFKTCFALKVKVGQFHYVDRATIVTALNAIVDYTISLLLV